MINYVTKEGLNKVISGEDNRKEKFITVDGNKFIALDNRTGDALQEPFNSLSEAVEWINISLDDLDYQYLDFIRKLERRSPIKSCINE